MVTQMKCSNSGQFRGSYRACFRACFPVLLLGSLVLAGTLPFLACGKTERQSAETGAPAGLGKAKTLYTCGMHPEIIQDHPGDCPKCKMKLTPMDPDRARSILKARGELPDEPEDAGTGTSGVSAPAGRKILYYRSSMDPSYVRNEPGKDTMGMDLVPVYEGAASGGPTITIDPVTEQNMALRYATVRRGPLEKLVRTVGTISYSEQGLANVTMKIAGWVQTVHVNQTGVPVKKGQPLFDFYSPQLFSAQQEYRIALDDLEKARKRGSSEALEMAQARADSAKERLVLFDITNEQIQEIEKAKGLSKTLTIRSQIDGVVTDKEVVEGAYLEAGMTAYRIADLSKVWVMGKVYESDLPFIQVGQSAQMTLDYIPGKSFAGAIDYVYPYLQEGTREVQVRLVFANPDNQLKPGMYATITIRSALAEQAVLVPDMAVIDTGRRKVVYVLREPGKFESRAIQTGARSGGNEYQVLEGLEPGQTVVVSGQFLLDSESRLREASLKMLNPGLTEASPATPDAKTADKPEASPTESIPSKSKTIGATLYTCPMEEHAHVVSNKPGECPECGMDLVPTSEVEHGAKSETIWRQNHPQ